MTKEIKPAQDDPQTANGALAEKVEQIESQHERLDNLNPFAGTIHNPEDGSREFVDDGKVGGVNNWIATRDDNESRDYYA